MPLISWPYQRGGQLAIIKDQATDTEIRKMTEYASSYHENYDFQWIKVWIGLNDLSWEGNWYWAHGYESKWQL